MQSELIEQLLQEKAKYNTLRFWVGLAAGRDKNAPLPSFQECMSWVAGYVGDNLDD